MCLREEIELVLSWLDKAIFTVCLSAYLINQVSVKAKVPYYYAPFFSHVPKIFLKTLSFLLVSHLYAFGTKKMGIKWKIMEEDTLH